MEKLRKRVLPKLATEAAEAQWRHNNRRIHGKQMHAAVTSGEAQLLAREKLLARIEEAKKKSSR
jgi:hypothetical protein